MTNRDLQQLEALANRGAPKPPEPLSEEATALGLRVTEQLAESVELAESALKSLGVLLEDFPLAKALIGAIGISAMEIRSQMPALRQAVKEAGE
jgi:hypothetical protein